MAWLVEYAPLISAVMSGVTAIIWIVYLNVFLSSYRRQHRPSILITAAGGKGMNAHCFVTNLGLEPVFLIDVILDVTLDDGRTFRAIIPERNERHTEENDDDARGATNIGPLSSAEEKDIGRFRTLIARACTENPDMCEDMPFSMIKITVVCVTTSRAALYGATRQYVIGHNDNGSTSLRPTTITAKQVDGWFERRAIAKELRKELGTAIENQKAAR